MSYDDFLVERIRQILQEKKANFYEKKMMGGLVFMVSDKMLCGTHIDKKRGRKPPHGTYWRGGLCYSFG